MLEYDVVVLAEQRLDKVTSIKARDIFFVPDVLPLGTTRTELPVDLFDDLFCALVSFFSPPLVYDRNYIGQYNGRKKPQKHTNFEHSGVHRREEYQKDHSKRDGGCEPQEACLF